MGFLPVIVFVCVAIPLARHRVPRRRGARRSRASTRRTRPPRRGRAPRTSSPRPRPTRSSGARKRRSTRATRSSRAFAVETVRIDKWLWAARFFKTRTAATDAVARRARARERCPREAVEGCHPGDTVEVRIGHQQWTVVVRGVSEKRGSASIAATLYEETPESAARPRAARARAEAVAPARRRSRRAADEAGPPADREPPPPQHGGRGRPLSAPRSRKIRDPERADESGFSRMPAGAGCPSSADMEGWFTLLGRHRSLGVGLAFLAEAVILAALGPADVPHGRRPRGDRGGGRRLGGGRPRPLGRRSRRVRRSPRVRRGQRLGRRRARRAPRLARDRRAGRLLRPPGRRAADRAGPARRRAGARAPAARGRAPRRGSAVARSGADGARQDRERELARAARRRAARNCRAADPETLERVRELAVDLRPRSLDDLGLPAAAQHLAATFTARTGVPVEVYARPRRSGCPPRSSCRSSASSRRRCRTSPSTHDATRVRVTLTTTPTGTVFEVADDGSVLETASAEPHRLASARERLRLVGGRLTS